MKDCRGRAKEYEELNSGLEQQCLGKIDMRELTKHYVQAHRTARLGTASRIWVSGPEQLAV